MKTLKHIGKMVNTGVKVLVVFRTLPGESDKALVLPTATLPDAQHDAVMDLVETDQAQESFEFGEIMFMRSFSDGRPMLRACQVDGRLQKVDTDSVIMTPDTTTELKLSELNVLIAEQRNCSIDELCNFVKGAPNSTNEENQITNSQEQVQETKTTLSDSENNGALSDKDLAKSYRSQADALYKEAARLRREAEELDPTAKKTSKKTAESA